MSLPSFGIRHPVVANLLMFGLLFGGLVFGLKIRREFFPEISTSTVAVRAPYPGAAPDEVERSLARKIEDALRNLRDVKEISSTINEGLATVVIEFESGKDIDAAVADVKREMDSLQDLPDAAERITVSKIEANLPAIILSIYGDGDPRTMKRAIRTMRDDLRSLPGMGQVVVSGSRVDEIAVEVRPSAALRYGLSLPAIARRITEAMAETPGGEVRSPTANINLRTPGRDEHAKAVRQIAIKANPDGHVVRLGDIASVEDSFADVDVAERLNGKPAVSLTVYKVGKQDAVLMAQLVKAYAAGLQNEHFPTTLSERFKRLTKRPGTLTPLEQAWELGQQRRATSEVPGNIAITTDLARFIVGRLNLLTRNAINGGILVFLVLFLFLHWRVSIWVLAGMIVSLMGTLIMMQLVGITLNLLTMFGLIIVVGILVDDAIVIAENIVAQHEAGHAPKEAAIRGAQIVAWPVVATVLTTIFAFFPLNLIEGRIGDMLAALPIVVTVALSISLIESLFILPVHMEHSIRHMDLHKRTHKHSWLMQCESRMDHLRQKFIKLLLNGYTRLLTIALPNRYLAVMVAFATIIASIGMILGGRVDIEFLTTSDAETINGELHMPIGTPASVTDAYVKTIEHAAQQMPEVKSVFSIIGQVASLEGTATLDQPHLAQIILELTPVEERAAKGQDPSNKVIDRLREALKDKLVGIKSLRWQEIQGGMDGPPINIGVIGDDQQMIEQAVEDIKHRLAKHEGVYDIADDTDAGQEELRFHLRPGASELGLTIANVAEQIRGAVYGLEPYTFAGDEEDVDVRVRYPKDFRRNLAALESMYIFTPDNTPVPLPEVVSIERTRSYSTIRRYNGKRAVDITAEVNDTIENADRITYEIFSQRDEIESRYPGVKLIERGQSKDMKESFSSLPMGFAVAIVLVYITLAWLFESYTQPLIVLSAVPFAIIGVIWGHYLLGFRMTFLSMIGFIALSGIVVNDSLIFVQFFNQMRASGLNTYAACVATGRARLRAILLTTITTVFGLLPLLLERSFQARFLIPMAITIAFGLLSATLLVLVLLPTMLMILADLKRTVRMLWKGIYEAPEPTTLPANLDTFAMEHADSV